MKTAAIASIHRSFVEPIPANLCASVVGAYAVLDNLLLELLQAYGPPKARQAPRARLALVQEADDAHAAVGAVEGR